MLDEIRKKLGKAIYPRVTDLEKILDMRRMADTMLIGIDLTSVDTESDEFKLGAHAAMQMILGLTQEKMVTPAAIHLHILAHSSTVRTREQMKALKGLGVDTLPLCEDAYRFSASTFPRYPLRSYWPKP